MSAFARKDTPTIMDGMVVRYQYGRYEISASRNCLMVEGIEIKTPSEFNDLMKVMWKAYFQYIHLSRSDNPFGKRIAPIAENDLIKEVNKLEMEGDKNAQQKFGVKES